MFAETEHTLSIFKGGKEDDAFPALGHARDGGF